jgi:hypothetical protein
MSTLLDRIIGKEFKEIKPQILEYVQSDIRKLMFIENLYKKKPQLLNRDTLHTIFQTKSYNEDAKKITRSLIHHHVPIQDHNTFMNETDRTIVALLWHENIADTLLKIPPEKSIPFYIRILDNICYADYIDRITFQNQIWLFNEMSSMMKTFHNNKIFHDTFPNVKPESLPSEIRFTKVLTKYSTEYNNILFIYNMCQELDMDKKDLVSFFQEMRLFFNSEEKDFLQSSEGMAQMDLLFENYNITKLDIKRMYRYLDKNVKKESDTLIEDDEDDE